MFDLIGSGMTANKEWLEVTSNNIVNINTTRTANGGPYHRQAVVFEAKEKFDNLLNSKTGEGVEVKKVVEDKNETLVYNPEHPDANKEGYVRYPAINIAAEMTNMMQAQRGYQSTVTTFNNAKKMMEKTFEIGRA